MKKAFTIIGKILAYTVSLLLIAFIVALALLLHPKSFNSIVRSQTDKHLNCTCEIEKIELSLFNQFPRLELNINNLYLLNPFADAPNDTVLGMKQLKASVHLGSLLTQRALVIDTFFLDRLSINAYIDSTGKANFDILKWKSDPDDTSSFTLPFSEIRLGQLSLKQARISYRDLSDSITAESTKLDIDLGFSYKGQTADGILRVYTPELSFAMNGDVYVNKDTLEISLPLSINKNEITLQNALLALNHYQLESKGSLHLQDQGIRFDLNIKAGQAGIKQSLKLIPSSLASLPEGVSIDGLFDIEGKIEGLYNDSLMPVFTLYSGLENTSFNYNDPALSLNDISSRLKIFVDLNHHQASYLRLENLKASTETSDLQGMVFVNDLLGDDMLIYPDLIMNLDLSELKPFLPDDMDIELIGRAKGPARASFSLSAFMQMDVQQMNIIADFIVYDFKGRYEEYSLKTPKGRLNFEIPNASGLTSLLNAHLYQCNILHATMDSSLGAELLQADIHFELSDVFSTTDSIAFTGKLQAREVLVFFDSISAVILNPKAELAMKIDFTDSTAVSDIFLDVEAKQLYGQMDSLFLNIENPVSMIQMKGQPKDESSSLLIADYYNTALSLRYGPDTYNTKSLGIKARATEDSSQDQLLLRWNPIVEVYMQEGDIQLSSISERIHVPDIRFDYSNEAFNIIDSRIQLGNSDFQLMGEVLHIGDYLNKTGSLKGDLNFVSNLTDVNQIMNLTSGLGGSEEPELVAQEDIQPDTAQDSGPFMVPKNIDVTIHTSIMNAYVGNQIATNLTGRLYVKDNALILEEIGFISAAARLMLTAIYRSPRPNHLYLGLDYHMLDIQIDELLSMFPDLDTIMPMLSSFKGQGEFHLAAETYLDKNYNLKKSTLRGASSIRGDNLVLMDSETFGQISNILLFNKRTENRVDSLTAEFTVFKNEVDVYPFTIVMDKYKAVVGGRHNLDMSFDYHISLLESPFPTRLGVDIRGTMDDLKIRPAACKYAENYRPVSRRLVDNQKLQLRKLIRETLIRQME